MTLSAAQNYKIRNWCSVPIHFRTKKPVIGAWQELRLRYHELPKFFGGRCNIGVLLGEPSAWLIDVDLDHPLAVELAPKVLPITDSIFGRHSKRRSHWLYQVTAPTATKKVQAIIDGNKAMLLEIATMAIPVITQ